MEANITRKIFKPEFPLMTHHKKILRFTPRANINGFVRTKTKQPKKLLNFLPLLYSGNIFAVASLFQCSLSAWSFLFCLYQNHHLYEMSY